MDSAFAVEMSADGLEMLRREMRDAGAPVDAGSGDDDASNAVEREISNATARSSLDGCVK